MFDYKDDVAYHFYIKESDRRKALNLIRDGLREYKSDLDLDFMGEDYFSDCEVVSTKKHICFNTIINTLDELLKLQVDGRGKNKIKVIFGVGESDEFFCADELLRSVL